MTVRFRLLGAVQATMAGRPCPIPAGSRLVILAGLLLRANQVVSPAQLAGWLWDEPAADLPRAKATVQTYLARLRESLGDADLVRTVPGGYLIEADEHTLDLLRFRALAERGRQAAAAADHRGAADASSTALGLWQGDALSNVDSEALHRDEVPRLDELRLTAHAQLVDAQLAMGGHRAVVGELTGLVRRYPLRERLWEQLMLALYRGGRQADALDAYRQVSASLAEELGLDPGPGLQRLQQAILAADPELASPVCLASPTGPTGRPGRGDAAPGTPASTPDGAGHGAQRRAPRQLPSDITNFTGRDLDLKVLAELVPAEEQPTESVVTAVIEGTAGVGKTALAVRFAHQIASRFPDGQLYVNLRGHGPGEPVSQRAALEMLLQSLGVPGDQVADELDARSALWRTHTAGRRLLVLLDNAKDTDQVRPLLPGPGCLVLVTSRSQLRGLAARDGARRVSVDQLGEQDAVALLAGILGQDRVSAEPAAAGSLVERCVRLPLAIRIFAERASQYPATPLAEFLAELESDRDRLAVFDLDDGEDTNLRAVFSRSYEALPADAAELFRLLGTAPGVDLSTAAAAALAGIGTRRAQQLLGKLNAAHLIEQRQPHRFEFHDLMRSYAAELAEQLDGEPVRTEAADRILAWYTKTALNAGRQLDPYRQLSVPGRSPLVHPIVFASYRQALDWCDAERLNLVAAVQHASRLDMDRHAWQLAAAQLDYFTIRNHTDDWLTSYRLGLAAAQRAGERDAEARMHNGLGIVCKNRRQYAEAVEHYQVALRIRRETGDRSGAVAVLNNLAISYRRLDRYDDSVRAAEQALEVAESIRSGSLTAVVLATLAQSYLAVQRAADAACCARRSLATWRELGNPKREALALSNLAAAQARLGEHAEAEAGYRQARELHRELGMSLDEADVLAELGDLSLQRGDRPGAAGHWRHALRLFDELRHPGADDVRAKLDQLVRSGRA